MQGGTKASKVCNDSLATALTSTSPDVVVRSCAEAYSLGAGASYHRASSHLNPSQLSALDAAMSRRLTLVQGPPGTGKTSMSVEIIGTWVRANSGGGYGGGYGGGGGHLNQNEKVFCGSDSNIAVDNLLEVRVREERNTRGLVRGAKRRSAANIAAFASILLCVPLL